MWSSHGLSLHKIAILWVLQQACHDAKPAKGLACILLVVRQQRQGVHQGIQSVVDSRSEAACLSLHQEMACHLTYLGTDTLRWRAVEMCPAQRALCRWCHIKRYYMSKYNAEICQHGQGGLTANKSNARHSAAIHDKLQTPGKLLQLASGRQHTCFASMLYFHETQAQNALQGKPTIFLEFYL